MRRGLNIILLSLTLIYLKGEISALKEITKENSRERNKTGEKRECKFTKTLWFIVIKYYHKERNWQTGAFEIEFKHP